MGYGQEGRVVEQRQLSGPLVDAEHNVFGCDKISIVSELAD